MRRERGSATVELALVIGLLLLLVLGGTEYGLAFNEFQDITGATREGARVGAAAGDEPSADCRILEAAAGALQSVEADQVIQMWVYETDIAGTMGARNRYRPAVSGDDPVKLKCSGAWFELEDAWPPSARDNKGVDRDWIGVQIIFDHDWQTGFGLWTGSVCDRGAELKDCWRQETVMHIEPDPTP